MADLEGKFPTPLTFSFAFKFPLNFDTYFRHLVKQLHHEHDHEPPATSL